MFSVSRRIQRNQYIMQNIKRCYCHNTDNMSRIRNIGILAHIDAGNYYLNTRLFYLLQIGI